jgi:hypothetical protein
MREAILGFDRQASRIVKPAPRFELTLDSPPLTSCSPALGVSAGKSGGGGGEQEVSSVQNVVLLFLPRIQELYLGPRSPKLRR